MQPNKACRVCGCDPIPPSAHAKVIGYSDTREPIWLTKYGSVLYGLTLPTDYPEVIGHSETGAPIWLTPFGDILYDLPIPFLDVDGNEVFE